MQVDCAINGVGVIYGAASQPGIMGCWLPGGKPAVKEKLHGKKHDWCQINAFGNTLFTDLPSRWEAYFQPYSNIAALKKKYCDVDEISIDGFSVLKPPVYWNRVSIFCPNKRWHWCVLL